MTNPDNYNQKQIDIGRFTGEHLTALTAFWQEEHYLTPDGAFGPNTRAKLMGSIGDEDTEPAIDARHLQVLRIAINEVGNGEDPLLGNNRGEDIERYRAGDGTGIGEGGSGSWCGVFVSFCNYEVYQDDIPFNPSRGAKRLGKNIAAAGRECDLPEPGAVIVWDRGKLTWRGHIGICFSYDPTTDTLITIEGNKNGGGRRFAQVDYFTYPNGLWRKKLVRIATVAPRER